MKKSRIAILVIAIVVICAAVGVSFAAYNSSQIKDSITIGTGESIGIGVDTADRVYFAEEKGAKLVPRGALILKDSQTGNMLDKNVSLSGITNQIALMGKIKVRVSGAMVNKLNFTVKDIMCGSVPANDYVEVVILRNYTSTWHDTEIAYNKYSFAKGGALPTDKSSMPHYLGAEWNNTANKYVGGAKEDIQTVQPLPTGIHEFTMLVYFKLDAANMPNNLSDKEITFNIVVDAI